MNRNPFDFFASLTKKKNCKDKNEDLSAEVMIGQLFENGPLIEVMEFAPIPLEEKRKKILIEREKRLARKVKAKNESPKIT